MACVLRVLQVAALHALPILEFSLLIAPGETFAADVTPAEWLRKQIPPQFEVGHTLPPLTRWGWSMDMATRKELAERWGYAVEFGGYVSREIADAALQDPKSDNGQCLALVAQDSKVYKLGVLLERAFPGNPPPEAYLRDSQGNFILDDHKEKVRSPEMPQSFLDQAAEISAAGLARLHSRVPLTVILNGGEYGLNVLGFVQKYFEQDPTVVKAKGDLNWYEYLSRQKAREQKAVYDAVRRVCPDRLVYVYYPAGGGTHRRGPEATYRDQWGWDFKYMRLAEDLPSNEYYYKDFNSGWTGTNDMLTQALGAKGYELKYGGTNSYDWLCAGYRDDPKASAVAAFDPSVDVDANAPQFGDLRLYEGFLKCLYTQGMIGGCAGYFSFPKGGFGARFPEDKPPHWLVQMVVLARVHALFSHLEPFLREGRLLPGPTRHQYASDQPAYEFPTSKPNLRVLGRKMPNKPQWLLTAWAADGIERDATVQIPELGAVTLHGRAVGSVYTVEIHDSKPALAQVDADSLNAPSRLRVMADPGSSSVNLTWAENNTRMSGYQIERAGADGTNFLAVGRTREFTAGFSDSTAAPGQDYIYRVRAFLDNTVGPASEEVKVSVPAPGATTYPYKPFVPSTAAPISGFMPSTDGRPYFRRQGTATQLIVDGQPFLALSGQLENNTISYPRDLDKLDAVLDICQKQNQNTVEIPVQWRALEPEEGKFDFTVVDALITGCRKRNLKLEILWFGSWKNSESYYAPPWFINNTKRFFRAQKRRGGDHGMVSAFCEEACQADIKAFTTLMQHILETDSKAHTVILVQVENETGMFAEESRDLSGPAQAAFTGPVPAKLMSYLVAHKGKLRPHLEKLWAAQGHKESGTWTEIFGSSVWTDEVFMAWQVAQYVERVTVAGKAVYPLPMYANAWLDGDGKPGDYPTGGPVAKMGDIWRAAAPSLDALSPDIYGPDFQAVCASFNVDDNPMLVPEAYYYEPSAVAPFYAFGEVDAMLFGSYYIEGYGWGKSAPAPGQLHPVRDTFAVLREMAPLILEHQGNQSMTGFFQASDDEQFRKTLKGYKLEMAGTRPVYGHGKSAGGSGFFKGQVPGGAMVIAVAPDEFVVVGRGLKVSFTKADGQVPRVVWAASGHYTKGVWNQGAIVRLTEPVVKLADDKVEVYRMKLN